MACALLIDESEKNFGIGQNENDPILQLTELAGKYILGLVRRICETPKTDEYLGIAHGLAGMTYSVLLWSDVTGYVVPSEVKKTLDFIEVTGHAKGRGLSWPIRYQTGATKTYMESWCHGSPGYIHLWTIAARVFKNPKYLILAEKAAWTSWDDDNKGGTLCCGLTGKAYGLLNVYRHTGDTKWLARARELINPALEACAWYRENRYSLFQGLLGAQILASCADDLERATFPLFERSVKF